MGTYGGGTGETDGVGQLTRSVSENVIMKPATLYANLKTNEKTRTREIEARLNNSVSGLVGFILRQDLTV